MHNKNFNTIITYWKNIDLNNDIELRQYKNKIKEGYFVLDKRIKKQLCITTEPMIVRFYNKNIEEKNNCFPIIFDDIIILQEESDEKYENDYNSHKNKIILLYLTKSTPILRYYEYYRDKENHNIDNFIKWIKKLNKCITYLLQKQMNKKQIMNTSKSAFSFCHEKDELKLEMNKKEVECIDKYGNVININSMEKKHKFILHSGDLICCRINIEIRQSNEVILKISGIQKIECIVDLYNKYINFSNLPIINNNSDIIPQQKGIYYCNEKSIILYQEKTTKISKIINIITHCFKMSSMFICFCFFIIIIYIFINNKNLKK